MTLTRDPQHVPHYGVFEFSFEAEANAQHPIFETDFTVGFTQPDGATVTAEGFYDGGSTKLIGVFRVMLQLPFERGRLYGKTAGLIIQIRQVRLRVPLPLAKCIGIGSGLFAYDNGDWFLHIRATSSGA